jgi:hypothetical protein
LNIFLFSVFFFQGFFFFLLSSSRNGISIEVIGGGYCQFRWVVFPFRDRFCNQKTQTKDPPNSDPLTQPHSIYKLSWVYFRDLYSRPINFFNKNGAGNDQIYLCCFLFKTLCIFLIVKKLQNMEFLIYLKNEK